MFNGLQWLELPAKKVAHMTEISKAKDTEILLPIVFISPNTVAVGSSTGDVSIFKAGKSTRLQVLPHNGKSDLA
jgi:hypothetical protein